MKLHIRSILAGVAITSVILGLIFVDLALLNLPFERNLKAVSASDVSSKRIDLPVYPDTNFVHDFPSSDSYEATTDFGTTADMETLTKYYDALLRDQGCEPFHEEADRPDSRYLVYSWSDAQNLTPYRYLVHISLMDVTTSSEWAQSSKDLPDLRDVATLVHTSISHFPDPALIPLYGASTTTDTQYEIAADGYATKVISYVTDFTSLDVEAYYAQHMSEWGWKVRPDLDYQGSLVFTFADYGPMHMFLSGRAIVTTMPSDYGDTKVVLRVSGYNIKPLAEEHHK